MHHFVQQWLISTKTLKLTGVCHFGRVCISVFVHFGSVYRNEKYAEMHKTCLPKCKVYRNGRNTSAEMQKMAKWQINYRNEQSADNEFSHFRNPKLPYRVTSIWLKLRFWKSAVAHFFCSKFYRITKHAKSYVCSDVLKLWTRKVLETEFIKNRLSGASIWGREKVPKIRTFVKKVGTKMSDFLHTTVSVFVDKSSLYWVFCLKF